MGVADDESLDGLVPRRMFGKNLIDVVDEMLPVDLGAGMVAGVFAAGVNHDETRREFDKSGGSLPNIDVMDRHLGPRRDSCKQEPRQSDYRQTRAKSGHKICA